MGKNLKAQLIYYPFFLGAGRALGIRISIWNSCQVSEPFSRGPACLHLTVSCYSGSRMDPLGQGQVEESRRHPALWARNQNQGSGPLPLMGSGQGLCNGAGEKLLVPTKPLTGVPSQPHWKVCAECNNAKNDFQPIRCMVTGLSKETCPRCWRCRLKSEAGGGRVCREAASGRGSWE